MKKFYAFAAAALAAVSMNAQIYVVGEGDGLGWNGDGDPMTIQPNADGKYVFEISNLLQFKISTAKGSWDTFNANCRWINMAEEALGTEQPVYTSDGGGDMFTPWKGNYKFELQLNETPGENNVIGSCVVTTTTPKPDQTIAVVYVRGDMNGWGVEDKWKFETSDGVNYSFTCEGDTKIPAASGFKICEESWSGIVNNGLAGQATIGEAQTWWFNGGNTIVAEDFEGTITFTLGAPRANIDVLLTAKQPNGIDAPETDSNKDIEYFNLQGIRVANPENGVFIIRQGNKAYKVNR